MFEIVDFLLLFAWATAVFCIFDCVQRVRFFTAFQAQGSAGQTAVHNFVSFISFYSVVYYWAKGAMLSKLYLLRVTVSRYDTSLPSGCHSLCVATPVTSINRY